MLELVEGSNFPIENFFGYRYGGGRLTGGANFYQRTVGICATAIGCQICPPQCAIFKQIEDAVTLLQKSI